jgi:hypothetical protein
MPSQGGSHRSIEAHAAWTITNVTAWRTMLYRSSTQLSSAASPLPNSVSGCAKANGGAASTWDLRAVRTRPIDSDNINRLCQG